MSLKHSNVILFADDTTIYQSSSKENDLFVPMNNDLTNLHEWFKTNKLSLNVNKTKYMVFNNTNINNNAVISIGGEAIEKVQSIKFLGLTIDEELKWDKHISQCRNKVSSGVYVMNASKHILSSNHLRILYNSLVQSHLDYCNIIWGNALSKYTHPLQIQQNKALRCLSNAKYNAHTESLYKRQNILKIKEIHQIHIGRLSYNYIHRTLPPPLEKVFQRRQDINLRSTRQTLDINLPRLKRERTRRSYIYEAARLWNSYDMTLKSANSLNIFKNSLRRKFLDHYN